MVQYCVLYLFCCNFRPVSPRIRSSVLTASLRQNADGACLIITRTRRRALFVSDSLSRQYPSLLTRTPARAHSQAEKNHFALSPPRGQGSGRQIYAAEKRPHTVEYDYGGVDRTVPPDLCRRGRHGDLLIFCFLGGRLRTFLRAFRLRNGRREVSPPRIPDPRQVYKSEAGYTLFYPGHNDIHTKHDSDNAAKKLRSLATAVGKRFKRISFTVRQRSGISHSFSLQIADAPQNNASSVALL